MADPVKNRDPGFLLGSLDFHWIFTGGATRGVITSSCPNTFLEVRKDSTKTIKKQKEREKSKKHRERRHIAGQSGGHDTKRTTKCRGAKMEKSMIPWIIPG